MLSEPLLRLVLVRHGVTDANQKGLCLGRTDELLNADGRKGVQTLAAAIDEDLSCVAVACISPTKRTVETASILLKRVSVPVTKREELLEIQWPYSWEGRSWKEIAEQDPENFAAFAEDPADFSLDGGESLAEVQARMVHLYSEIERTFAGEAVLFVGHGCALQSLLCYLMGVKLSWIWPFEFLPASISQVIVYPGQSVMLRQLSFTPHFELSMNLSRADSLREDEVKKSLVKVV